MSSVKSKAAIILDLLYLSKGLVPPGIGEGTATLFLDVGDGGRVQKALDSMSEEESRTARRKFRKLHRKYRRELERGRQSWKTRTGYYKAHPASTTLMRREDRETKVQYELHRLRQDYGPDSTDPNYNQKSARRQLVFANLKDDK